METSDQNRLLELERLEMLEAKSNCKGTLMSSPVELLQTVQLQVNTDVRKSDSLSQ